MRTLSFLKRIERFLDRLLMPPVYFEALAAIDEYEKAKRSSKP